MALLTIVFVTLLAQNQVQPQVQQDGAGAQSRNVAWAQATTPLQLQVLLDRAHFSPGVIDGRMGANTRKALDAFNGSGLPQPTLVPATTTYRITQEDAAGPFIDQLPSDMMESAKLPSLSYTSLLEELAERFHTTPALLQQLNRGVTFAEAQEIRVPNVEPMVVPETMAVLERKPVNLRRGASAAPEPTGTSGKSTTASVNSDFIVTVTKSTSALTVTDSEGRVVLYAPVTTGSEHDPLPIGEWKVTGLWFEPEFHYNPDLFWDAEPTHTKATLPPGPNSPVGVVWINLSKEHYGLHGTPEPASIGRTESHGCVRLTNWDALRVAALAKPGTPVVFKE